MEKKHKKKYPPPLAGKHWAGTSPVAAVKPGPILQNSARWPLPVQQGKQPKPVSGTKKAKGPKKLHPLAVAWKFFADNEPVIMRALTALLLAAATIITSFTERRTSWIQSHQAATHATDKR